MKYPVDIPKPKPRYFEYPAFPIMAAILIFTHTIPHCLVHVYLSIWPFFTAPFFFRKFLRTSYFFAFLFVHFYTSIWVFFYSLFFCPFSKQKIKQLIYILIIRLQWINRSSHLRRYFSKQLFNRVSSYLYDQTLWKIQVKKFDFSNFAGI